MCLMGVFSAKVRIFRTTLGSAKHLIDSGLVGTSPRLCSSEPGSGVDDCEIPETPLKNGVLQCSVSLSSIPSHSASTKSGRLRSFTGKSDSVL